jgi:regulator of G-protein signaling
VIGISVKKIVTWFLVTELYEGLKRAQRSRLEDQRGTEINFELPDFLKVW